MTKINSSWKGCNERRPQLASALFFIYPALIPVTFGHQPNVIYVRFAPWMWKASLFLNDGRRLGCRAEDLGRLTWPKGESLQVCGSHRNRTLTPEGERPWEHCSRALRCTWGIMGTSSRPPSSSPYISVALLFEAFASFLSWGGFFLTLIISYFSFYETCKPACGRDCKLTPRSFLTSFCLGLCYLSPS